jgi:hypothetical protein
MTKRKRNIIFGLISVFYAAACALGLYFGASWLKEMTAGNINLPLPVALVVLLVLVAMINGFLIGGLVGFYWVDHGNLKGFTIRF